MAIDVRAITDDEIHLFRSRIARGFGSDIKEDEVDRFRATIDPARTVAAFDGDDIVGTGAALDFDVTVPGGTLAMGGTTIITVSPTHRRRGVLTQMMRVHFDEIRGRGEPLAGLWASETPIYGRFGYGWTVSGNETKIDGRAVEFIHPAPSGDVRLVDEDRALDLIRPVYDRVRISRPGMLSRSDAWWTWRAMGDPEYWREGRSKKRYAVYEGPNGVDGYAIYRQKEKWIDFPDGEVALIEVIAATDDAHHALWRYLLRVDLFPRVVHFNLPMDDPLPWLIKDHRRVLRTATDSMWLRLLDIPRCLSERTYTNDGRIVIGVRDPFMPENDGAYALDASTTGGVCARVDQAPEIELDVSTLAAGYLGEHRFTTMARAGMVVGTQDALERADRIFAPGVRAWVEEIF